MSQRFDSTDAIERTASVPTRTAFTIGGWILLPSSAPGSDGIIFSAGTSGWGAVLATLRWSSANSAFRFGNDNNIANLSSNPSFNQWIYFFLSNGVTNLTCGWKTISDSSFTTQTVGEVGGASVLGRVCVGTNPFYNTLAMDVFRLSMWGEEVTPANLLLAAATDLGYTTNINTHLPLTNGIGSPWADTSGNARDWTTSGTFSDQSDPNLGSALPSIARIERGRGVGRGLGRGIF